MKKRKFYQFFATVLALALVGCNHGTLTGDDPDDQNSSKDALYMNVKVQLPTGPGTRSTTNNDGTSSSGTETGKDYENAVNSMLLVLADKNNKFICSTDKSGDLKQNGKDVTAVQSVSKSVLAEYYGENGTLTTSNEINVFVFCNPTDALRRIFAGVSKGDETWHEQICSISEKSDGTADNAAIWGGTDHQGGFLMSSYAIATKRLPTNFSDWDNFTTKENPFKLSDMNSGIGGEGIDNGGSIKVERSVARFDFKDGSPKGNNTYDVIFDQTDKSKCLVQIQLTKMALVNMSKNFYYLRRVSADGLVKNGFSLCGAETATNYVVDTDADTKEDGSIIRDKTYDDHFNFCLGHSTADNWVIDGTAREQWYHSTITSVLNGSPDNDDTWNDGKPDAGYRIWRYVTENTIPGETSNQKHGVSTGIVFKGKMVPTDNNVPESELYKALSMAEAAKASDPILYAYGTDLYVRWTEVRAMAIKQGTASPMYKAVFGSPADVTPAAAKADGTGAVYSDDENSADYKWDLWFNTSNAQNDDALKTFKKAATDALFTLYQRSDDGDSGSGYYCHYYYWNRHNNNDKPAVMGLMEFGVVRNNVYKLAVTKISKLGHPRITENDPDPENPDNPDEDGDVYLSVSVEVLPWVVRINDIEF